MSKINNGRVFWGGVAALALVITAAGLALRFHNQPASLFALDGWDATTTTSTGDVTVIGKITVANGVVWTIDSTAGQVTITADSLEVQPGGSILIISGTSGGDGVGGAATADGVGTGKGLAGSASKSGGGGAHGGAGGDGSGNTSSGGTTYDSNVTPTLNGSGGGGGATTAGGAGGGSVKFVISGATIVTDTGIISANGSNGTGASYGSGAGSGGSIYLNTAILSGTGTISANGGNAVGGGGAGGGGRIAIYCDNNSFLSDGGTISVAQGTGNGTGAAIGSAFNSVSPVALFTGGTGAGYEKKAAYFYTDTSVAVWDGGGADNNANTAANWVGDTLPGNGSSIYFNDTSVKDCNWNLNITPANFTLDSGYGLGTVTLKQDLTLTTTGTSGSITINSFGGKLADAGFTVSFKNVLIVDAEANRLTSTGTWIMNTTGGVFTGSSVIANRFNRVRLAAGVAATISSTYLYTNYLDLQNNSSISGGLISIFNSTTDSPITQGTNTTIASNVRFNSNISQGALTITGQVDCMGSYTTTMTGDWNVGRVTVEGNPVQGSMQTLDTNGYNLVVNGDLRLGALSGTYGFGKILFGTNARTHKITGSIYTQGGADHTHGYIDFGTNNMINVGGNIDYRGVSVISIGTSTVNLTGTAAAAIYSIADYTYKDSTYDTVNTIGTAPFYNLTSTVAGKIVSVEAGKTLTIGQKLSLAGTSGTGNLLTFQSTAANSAFTVDLTNGYAAGMNYLNVIDSNATAKNIVVTNSTLLRTNANWISAAAGSVYWTNASGDGKWSTDANWSTGVAPVLTDTVYFNAASTAPCNVDAGVTSSISIANLTLDTGYTGTLTLSSTPGIDLTVSDTVTIKAGALKENSRNINFKNFSCVNVANLFTSTGSTGTWIMNQGNGTFTCSSSSWTSMIYILRIPSGVTATSGAASGFIRNLVLDDNSHLVGSLVNLYGSNATPLTQGVGATITAPICFFQFGGTLTVGNLNSSNSVDIYGSGANAVIQMTGDWVIGGLVMDGKGGDPTYIATLDTNNQSLTVNGNMVLGISQSGVYYYAKILFKNGTHKITGNMGTGGSYTHGYFDFTGTSTVQVGGNIDFRYASVRPGTATVNLIGTTAATIYALTSTDVDTVNYPASIINTAPFYNLTSTVAGKIVSVEAGKTLTIGQKLSLAGTSGTGNLLTFQSTAANSAFTVDLTNGYAAGMNYLNVIDSNATAKNIVVTNSTLLRTNANWISGVTGAVYWTNGSGDGKWSTAANWSTGVAPVLTDTVYFNAASTANCTIGTAVTVANIYTQSGYTGTITAGANLTVTSNLDLTYGTFAPGTYTVNLTGNGKLTASPSNTSFYNLTAAVSGMTTTIARDPTKNMMVAVGQGTNTIAYSSDGGVTWIGLGTSIFSSGGYGVCWNGSKFVAVGQGTNSIAYSSDGITWTGVTGTNIFGTNGFGVCWNGSKFVAVGYGNNSIAYSTDGINWTALSAGILGVGRGICWNGSKFVAVGDGANTIVYSTDGITWTGLGTSVFSTSGYSVCWNGSKFVAVGSGTNSIAYSSDGITWVGVTGTNIFGNYGLGICWNGSKFVAVGSATNAIAYSSDGITWTGLGTSMLSNAYGICWNGSKFVAVGSGTNAIAYSSDGITWTGVSGTGIFSSASRGVCSTYAPKLTPPVLSDDIIITNALTLGGGTLTLNSTDQVALTITNTANTSFVNSSSTINSGVIIRYKPKAASSTISIPGGSYSNATLEAYDTKGATTYQLDSNITALSALKVYADSGLTTAFNLNGKNLTASGLTLGLDTAAQGAVTLNAGSGTVILPAVSNIVPSTNAGTHTINLNTSTWNVAGNWNTSGYYLNINSNTSTVNLTGTGTLTTSPTNTSFYNLTAAASGQTTTIARDPTKNMIVVGGGSNTKNCLAYSTDNGVTWTGLGNRISITSVYDLCWGNGKFVAVGAGAIGSNIVFSTDGINWTRASNAGGLSTINGVCWNGSKFVAVGNNGSGGNCIAYSTDGDTWTGVTGTDIFIYGRGVCWNGSLFVACGNGSYTIATSPDGINWTGRATSSLFSSRAYRPCWNGKIFVVGGGGTNSLAYSYDGISWVGLGTDVITLVYGVCWTGTQFVAAGNGVNTFATSPDGINWTGRGGSSLLGTGWNIFWNGTKVIAAGSGNSTIATSTDNGITWTGVTDTSIFDNYAFCIASSSAPELTPPIYNKEIPITGTFTLGGGTLARNSTDVVSIALRSGTVPIALNNSTINSGVNIQFAPIAANTTVSLPGGNYGAAILDAYAVTSGTTYNLAGSITGAGQLNVLADTGLTTIFNMGANNLVVSDLHLGKVDSAIGAVTLNSGSSTVTLSAINKLIPDNGGSHTLNLNTSTWNVAGDIIPEGLGNTALTLNPNTSTVILNPTTSASLYALKATSTLPLYNLTSTAAGKTIKIEAAKTVSITGNLTLQGANGNLLALNSTTSGTAANLNVTGTATASSYLNVKDSNATGKGIVAMASTIDAYSLAHNWVSAAANAVYWTNASGDGKWSTAANWSTGAVPSSSSNVYFSTASTAPCNVDAGVTSSISIANLTLDTGYTGTLTLSATSGIDLTVTNNITINTNGGKLVDNGRTVNFVNINFASDATVFTPTGTWIMTASGTIASPYNIVFNTLQLASKPDQASRVVATLGTGGLIQIRCNKLILGDNSNLAGSILIMEINDNSVDPIIQGSGATISIPITLFGRNFNQGALTSNSIITIWTPGYTDKMTGDWNIKGLQFCTWPFGTLDTNNYNLTTDYIENTQTTAGYGAKILFRSGTHTINGNIFVDGSSAISSCATHSYLDFGSSTVNISGNLDLRGFSVIPFGSNTPKVNFFGTGTSVIYSIADYGAKDSLYDTVNTIGTAPFYNLTANVAGKTIKFEAGKTVTVANNLSLSGTGTGSNLLTLNSTISGTAAYLNVAKLASGMQFLNVQDSDASLGRAILVDNNTTIGSGTTNWFKNANSNDIIWTNASGNGLWSNNANWLGGVKPGPGNNVVFSGVSIANCTINEASVVQDLTTQSGYLGTITAAANLTVSRNLDLTYGKFIGNNNTTVTLSGTGNLIANPNNTKFYNLTCANGIGLTTTIVRALNQKIWVAGGSGSANALIYSENGTSWVPLGKTIFSDGISIAYNGSRWVAGGDGSNTLAYSDDGKNWVGLGKGLFNTFVLGLGSNGDAFVAAGGGPDCLAYSTDGIIWSGVGQGIFGLGRGVGYSKSLNRWVAAGDGSNTLAYSDNGTNWVPLGRAALPHYGLVVVWNGKMFVAGGEYWRSDNSYNPMPGYSESPYTIAYSYDGINWTPVADSGTLFNKNCRGIAWDGKKFVAVGDGADNSIAYSYDGITWTGLGKSMFHTGYKIAYNGSQFIAVGSGGPNNTTMAYSTDGITGWSKSNNPTDMSACIDIASAPAPMLTPPITGDDIKIAGALTLNGGTLTSSNANQVALTLLNIANTSFVPGSSTISSGVIIRFKPESAATVNIPAVNYGSAKLEAYATANNTTFQLSDNTSTDTNLNIYAAAGVTNTAFNLNGKTLNASELSFGKSTSDIGAITFGNLSPTASIVNLSALTSLIPAVATGQHILNLDNTTWNVAGSWDTSGNNIMVNPGTSSTVNLTGSVAGNDLLKTSPTNAFYNLNVAASGKTTTIARDPSKNMLVAVGEGINSIAYSTDGGATWVGLGKAIFSSRGNSVCWNGEKFVAFGTGTNTTAYSTDGINWIGSNTKGLTFSDANNAYDGVCWDGQRFVAVGKWSQGTIATSTDGITWNAVPNSTTIFSAGFSITWNGLVFVAVGAGGNTIAYATDPTIIGGNGWIGAGNIFGNNGVGIGVAWNGSVFVATGKGDSYTIATSLTGASWAGVAGSKNLFSVDGAYRVAWNGSVFVAVGAATPNTIAWSTNGIDNWTGLSNSVIGTYGMGICWNGTKFIVVGAGTNSIATATDPTKVGNTTGWTAVSNSSKIFSMYARGVCSTYAPELTPPIYSSQIPVLGTLTLGAGRLTRVVSTPELPTEVVHIALRGSANQIVVGSSTVIDNSVNLQFSPTTANTTVSIPGGSYSAAIIDARAVKAGTIYQLAADITGMNQLNVYAESGLTTNFNLRTQKLTTTALHLGKRYNQNGAVTFDAGTGTVTIPALTNIIPDNAGSHTLNLNASTWNVAGDIIPEGAGNTALTLLSGTSTVNLEPVTIANLYALKATNTLPLHNLISTAAGKTIQVEAGKTLSVDGNLTLQGVNQTGQTLTFQSTTAGALAFLNVSGSATDNKYLTIKDSDARPSAVQPIKAPTSFGTNIFGWDISYFNILTPTAGQLLYSAMNNFNITWESVPDLLNKKIKIQYRLDANDPASPWVEINNGVYDKVSNGSEKWLPIPAVRKSAVQLRISADSDNTIYNDSAIFKVKPGIVTLLTPNGTMAPWKVLSDNLISWSVSGTMDNVKLFYSTNSGSSWTEIVTAAPIPGNASPYSWNIPSEAQSDHCRIKIADAADLDEVKDISTMDFAIKPEIILTSFNGPGQSLVAGNIYPITWNTHGILGTIDDMALKFYYLNNLGNWVEMYNYNVPNKGTLDWLIPLDAVSSNCKIRAVSVTDPLVLKESAAGFEVSSASIIVDAPVANAIWATGDTQIIKWHNLGTINDNLTIDYSASGDFTDARLIKQNQANTGSYQWIPDVATPATAKIRIKDMTWASEDHGSKDVSGTSAAFTIVTPKIIAKTPDIGTRLIVGGNATVTWESYGSAVKNSSIKIAYSPSGYPSGYNDERVIVASTDNDGSYIWENIPDTISDLAKLRVYNANLGTIYGEIGPFTIAGSLQVTAPTVSERFFVGETKTFEWSTISNATIPSVKLSYSKNGIGADAVWYNMDGKRFGDAGYAPTVVTNATNYNWVVQDLVKTGHFPNDDFYLKVEDTRDAQVYATRRFSINYYLVQWKIDSDGILKDLGGVIIDTIDADTGAKFEDSVSIASNDKRYYYPGKNYNCTFSREGYLSVTHNGWQASSDGMMINIVMPTKPVDKERKVYVENSYDAGNDVLSVTAWLQEWEKQIVKNVGNVNGVTQARVYLYDEDENLISSSQEADSDALTLLGVNVTKWQNLNKQGKLMPGKNYIARVQMDYLGSSYWGSTSFQITQAVQLQTIQTGLGVTGSQTIVGEVGKKLGVNNAGDETIAAKVGAVADKALSILTAAEKTLPDKITQMKNDVTSSIQTDIKPHVQSGILTRTTTIKQGDTIDISYKTTSGLAPTITIYDSKDLLRFGAKTMLEVGKTGVYSYKVQFLNAWGAGEFTVVCNEATAGTVDALVITVTQSNLQDVSGQVSAIMGSTSGLSGIKNVADTLNTQFNVIDSTLAKLSANIVDKVTQTKDSLSNLQSVFTQLESISKQIKGIGGTEGINLEKLYNVSKDKKDDVTYIKNKTQELKAAMDLNQKMIENVANKPVVQTWFEFK